MSKDKLYRIKIHIDSSPEGDPVFWTHQGRQYVSTANKTQPGLLFEDEIESLRQTGFKVEVFETYEVVKQVKD